jgi:hypothetical protein
MNACNTKDRADEDFRTRGCGKMALDDSEVWGKGSQDVWGKGWEKIMRMWWM